MRWLGALRRNSNTPAAHFRPCNRVDRIANEVEDELLELVTICSKQWKVILNNEINANLRRGCLRSDENESILKHAADIYVTHKRPALQKLADTPHNVAGHVDLVD